jgi:hypothetical protein
MFTFSLPGESALCGSNERAAAPRTTMAYTQISMIDSVDFSHRPNCIANGVGKTAL